MPRGFGQRGSVRALDAGDLAEYRPAVFIDDHHAILPFAGGSDGAVFNPATMEAFSSAGNGTLTVIKENSPASFVFEQVVQTMPSAKTLTLDSKTDHILLIAAETTPPPSPPPAGGRGGRGQMVPGSFSILVVGK